ncbi:MAG: cellulase family glycosylhydrolase [Pirellulales bacterium]
MLSLSIAEAEQPARRAIQRRESADQTPDAGLPWIKVAPDRRGFLLADTQRGFIPWGFNYDHDERGRLIEDYWFDEWPKVEEDFDEMKQLGANVVRVHLQLGRFMETADAPNHKSLDQLARLLKLAERKRLYLNLTGLGCYQKRDVPAWYDQLAEQDRWDVQARFWEAVAARAADSPAVFCYDLMNEPLVAGAAGKQANWLAPPFAGKHFVQYIALETRDRPRHEIARQWIAHLAKSIRKHDRRHLITVGLVPWSLDRPGLSSGFIPDKIAGELDFVAMHIYPEKDKLDEALDILRGFAVGKPVVIEEMFPLRCSADELGQFIDKSQGIAAGWIGFYWGKTPDEYRGAKTVGDRITLDWLKLFEKKRPE